MTELRSCRDRELRLIVETFVEEGANAVHFVHGNERVPIWDRSPATGPGMQVVSGKTAGIGNQCGRRASIRLERLAIKKQLRIKFSWTPTMQHLADLVVRNSGIGNLEQLPNWRQVWSRSGDCANVQVAVSQTVNTSANARR